MIIESKHTTYASVVLTRIGKGTFFVVSAFLLRDGKPDTDLGQLCWHELFGIEEARARFVEVVETIESAEATGLLSDEMALRQLADYATRDRLGLVP
jgi:hypothetical protein